jgi:hypothetical protein
MILGKLPNVLLLALIVTLGLALMILSVGAQGEFTIDAKINTQKLNGADKLKVVASTNGDTQVKNVTSKDLKSKSTTVSFRFNKKITLSLLVVAMSILYVPMRLMRVQMK